MNINNLAPTVYEARVAVQQYAEQQVEYETLTRTRCPNLLHANGRIYASKPNEPYVAVTVSPYHQNFRSQIEDAVWPAIEAFLNKGYLTVSCCGGHVDPWWEYYIILAVGTEEQAETLMLSLKTVNNTTLEMFSTSANVCQYFENNKVKFRPLDELEKTCRAEYKDLNILFNRNYSQYYYVKIKFDYEKFKLPFNPFNFFSLHWFHKKEIIEFDKWKTNIVQYINSDNFEYFYG